MCTAESLLAVAEIPVVSSNWVQRTAVGHLATVAMQLTSLGPHILTVPSWEELGTRSPEILRTLLIRAPWPFSSSIGITRFYPRP